MNKFSAKMLCVGALVSALTVVLVLAGTYVPLLNLFAIFICGLPLCCLLIRCGVKITAVSLAAAVLVLFILTGNVLSAGLNACVVLLPGIAAGLAISKNYGFYKSLLLTALAVLIGAALSVMVVNIFSGSESGIADMLDAAIDSMKSSMEPMLEEAGNASGTDLTEAVNTVLAQIKTTVLSYFPSMMIIYSVIVGYLVYAASVFFVRRLRVKGCAYLPFNMITVPRSMSFVLVLLMLVTMFSESTSWIMLILKNASAVLSFLLAADGLSLLDFGLSRKIKSGYARFGIYAAVFVIGYFLISVIFYVLMLVGMIDSGRNIRMIKRAGGDDEN